MIELLKAIGFLSILLALATGYELSGKRADFTAKVSGKQRRSLESSSDLFVLEIWYECPNGPNVYSLFVSESDFNRLWEGDTITFSAKKGKLSPWLYSRKLLT